AVVVRDLRVEHAAYGEGRVGVRVVLHDVDAVGAGRRRALVVAEYLPGVGVEGQRHVDVDPGAVGQVEQRVRPVRATRQRTDRGPGGGLRALDDLVGQVLDVVQAVLTAERE